MVLAACFTTLTSFYGLKAYLVHVDGGNRFWNMVAMSFTCHAMRAKAVEHQERWVGKLLLMPLVQRSEETASRTNVCLPGSERMGDHPSSTRSWL